MIHVSIGGANYLNRRRGNRHNLVHMKNLVPFLLLIVVSGCKKEQLAGPGDPFLIREITVNGKTDQVFEYNAENLLVKENVFSLCENNPSDELRYTYVNGRVDKMNSVIRSLYSSTESICNPATGIHHELSFEYDDQQRISRVIQSGSVTEFAYNAAGFIEKQTIGYNGSAYVFTYEYDGNGNIIRETDSEGKTTFYEYDNGKNPFYLIGQRPAFVSPFNKSPNNVIKATGNQQFERQLTYNADGLPAQVTETNGLIYVYHYQ